MSTLAIDQVWEENPSLIKSYLNISPLHKKLCEEIEYIVRSRLDKNSIEVAHVTSRVKSLASFCEKTNRKYYSDPISEITDLSGIRIVFLYMSDLPKIEALIEKEFEIAEKENKLQSNKEEKFGYGALHYLVKIKKKHSGARYDDLRNLICEIQVRTILQDAWSIVAHHLSYKHETDVPKSLIRKLNALSGLFETADDQFESLKQARTQYINTIEHEISAAGSKTLNQNINLDNLVAYISTKFPNRGESSIETVSELLSEIKKLDYKKLSDLDSAVTKGLNAALEDEKLRPPTNLDTNEPTSYLGVGIVRTALAIVDKDYCLNNYSPKFIEDFKKYGFF